MVSWNDIASDNFSAAEELLANGRWRSAVSRAYYAVYARVTDLLAENVNMPHGRDNPSHKKLPDMVLNNLHPIKKETRGIIFRCVDPLYSLRVIADYRPSVPLGADAAARANNLMALIFQRLVRKR